MIHIKELFRLQNIHRLRLIAGQDGLERTVTEAVLFEYDPSRVQLPDFYRGDLVVTTLAYARGDAKLVAHSLQALMNQGIAGLMVKTAYFSELPQAVITLANRLGTPVFLFDDTYIEEVILQVTDLIRGKRHFAGFEQDVDALMRGDLIEEQTRERARRIDPLGQSSYRIYAVSPKERMVTLDDKLYALMETDADAAHRCTFIEWRRMMLALCREEDGLSAQEALTRFGDLLTRAGVDRQSVVIGQSDLREARAQMGASLCEAVYAARAAKLCGKAELAAHELGLYAYLFPMSENPFVCDRCRRVLSSIREYDAQNHTNLEQTALVYVKENMEIAAAAKVLFQHPNTVRYRLSKIQRIIGMEDDPLFAPMLSLTVSLSRILAEGQV
ncbi:MAG: PucR family transcriptional regulator ligand-binding domain-containing protein [Christensenellales bacterium]|nr:PucR family transcriptional regulator ligand-binding domain-containing protein [Christensenellales bacterium]